MRLLLPDFPHGEEVQRTVTGRCFASPGEPRGHGYTLSANFFIALLIDDAASS
jgi:hypothetical protein